MLKKWSEKIDIAVAGTFVFYILLCFWDITAPAKMYDSLDFVLKAMRYACYLVFALKFVYDALLHRELALGAVIVVGIAAVNILSVGEMKLGFTVLALASLRRMDCKRIVKWLFFALTVFFNVIVFLSLIRVIPDWTYMRDETVRHSLGFVYPTDAFSVVLVIVLLYFSAFYERISLIVAAVFMAVNVAMLVATDGRMSFLLITVVIISMTVYKFVSKSGFCISAKVYKALKICCALLPVVLFVCTFVFVLLYKRGTGIGNIVNTLLSDRLKHGANALANYPVRLFGTYVEWIGFGGYGYVDTGVTNFVYNFVDMSFLRILFDFGVVVTVLVVAGYTKLMYDTVSKKDTVLTLVMIVVVLWGFIEPYAFNVGRNVFVIYLAQYMNIGAIKIKR